MTLDVTQLLLLGLTTSTTHWIVARASITQPLWSRARGKLAELLACPACSGFWLGAGAWLCGIQPLGGSLVALPANMLLGAWTTPVFQAILLWSLRETAIELDS